ncbi:MAG: NAD(P)-binding protein [Lachnospiraceae bacterium]|nr:NAD(P)-binding protein [Lachnospiraceae bacterium]
MIRINQLKLHIDKDPSELEKKICHMLHIDKKEIDSWEICKRSVDARKKPELFFVYSVNVFCTHESKIIKRVNNNNVMLTKNKKYQFPTTGTLPLEHRPIIVGSGPAGLFCGYMLAKAGYRPLILERGQEAQKRQAKVNAFWENGVLDPESNVQFGEGGAGTFSDGKLNTLVKDPLGRNRLVLEILVEAGAPEEILYEQKPHLGTDLLINIVQNMRKKIEDWGGTYCFESKMTGFAAKEQQITQLEINGTDTLDTQIAVFALGHSARDTMEMLYEKGLPMVQKSFAVGVRVEHPQAMINESQYGAPENTVLGAANYKLTEKLPNGRGVYSFCMCPGGYVVNASSEQNRLAINGMSYQDRGSQNANSAIIVTVTPEDYKDYADAGTPEALTGMAFQRVLEERAYALKDGAVPVQLFRDFKGHRESTEFGAVTSAVKGRCALANVRSILPDFVGDAIEDGITAFGRRIKGYDRPDALVSGVESRTSSPVRIIRDEAFQSSIGGIYPCGEGAGYAGGITSAAMDGIKTAEEIAKKYIKFQS